MRNDATSRSEIAKLLFAAGMGMSVLVFGALAAASPENAPRDEVSTTAEAEAAPTVREKLQKKTTVTFKETPLREAIEYLGAKAGVIWWLEEQALADEGITRDTPINQKFEDVTIETVLEFVLEPLQLTWYVDEEVLRVTTLVKAGEARVTRVYDVSKLLDAMKRETPKPSETRPLWRIALPTPLQPAKAGGKPQAAIPQRIQPVQFSGIGGGLGGIGGLIGHHHHHHHGRMARPFLMPHEVADDLVNVIQQETAGPWFDFEGFGGTISVYGDLLVVRQTHHMHDDIAVLLDLLTKASLGERDPRSYIARPKTYPLSADEKVRKAMERRVDVEFSDTPLRKAVKHFSTLAGVPFLLDERALADEGIAPDTPLNFKQSDIRLGTAMDLILKPLRFKMVPQRGFAVVTTKTKAEELRYTVIYDVQQLLDQRDYDSLINMLQQETSGPWLDIDGFGGSISKLTTGLLVVRQTEAVHQQITKIFADLRKKRKPGASEAAQVEKKPIGPETITTRYHLLPPDFEERRQVAEAVPKLIEPKSWQGADAGQLSIIGKMLVVRHRHEIQERIDEFLNDLYEAERPQDEYFPQPYPQGIMGLGGLGGIIGGSGAAETSLRRAEGSFFNVRPHGLPHRGR